MFYTKAAAQNERGKGAFGAHCVFLVLSQICSGSYWTKAKNVLDAPGKGLMHVMAINNLGIFVKRNIYDIDLLLV